MTIARRLRQFIGRARSGVWFGRRVPYPFSAPFPLFATFEVQARTKAYLLLYNYYCCWEYVIIYINKCARDMTDICMKNNINIYI